jgi:hypothetical protein
MENLINIISPYELKARFFPALFTLLPLVLIVAIWYPELINLESSFITILFFFIFIFFVAKLARELGFKRQKQLLIEWGNFPSIVYLRLRDNKIDLVTKQRYHNYLNENVEGIKLPSNMDDELNNQDFYEQQYTSAIKWLLENTRDQQIYSILYQDNINYGFSRNMLGIKPMGFTFSILSLFINLYFVYQEYNLDLNLIPLKIWMLLIINIALIISWLFFVKKNWVKSSSEAYARSLLATCERIIKT